LSNPVNRQTDRQTDKHSNRQIDRQLKHNLFGGNNSTGLTYLLRLNSSRAAWHIGQQRVVSRMTGRQQQLHIPPM